MVLSRILVVVMVCLGILFSIGEIEAYDPFDNEANTYGIVYPPGTYYVKAQAKDSHGAISSWSSAKTITIYTPATPTPTITPTLTVSPTPTSEPTKPLKIRITQTEAQVIPSTSVRIG